MAQQAEEKHGRNEFDAEKALTFIDRIEKREDALLSLRASYMSDCKVERDAIKEIFREAKGAGHSKKSLKRILADRAAERKRRAEIEDLDIDERAQYEALREHLGDFAGLPLGQAALDRAAA